MRMSVMDVDERPELMSVCIREGARMRALWAGWVVENEEKRGYKPRRLRAHKSQCMQTRM